MKTDSDNMIQNTTDPAIIPQTYAITATTVNSTGEYYILSTTTISRKPIYCNIASGCYIECIAESSCASAYIYAGKTNNLTLICSGKSSCTDIYITEGPMFEANIDCIYPPYQSEYAFSLYCVAEKYSCQDVDIYLPDSNTFTTNYMELICPRTNREGVDKTDCDIRWYCLDLSASYSTYTVFDTTNYQYICNDNDCCPWTDSDNMIQNTTDPAIIPQTYAITATTVNSTGEYYILSTTTISRKPIYCNIASGCYIEC
eukprot:10064_1